MSRGQLLLQPLHRSFLRLLKALEAFIQHWMRLPMAIGQPVEPRALNRRHDRERHAGLLHGGLRHGELQGSEALSLRDPGKKLRALHHTQRCQRANSVQREEEQVCPCAGGREVGRRGIWLVMPAQPIPSLQLPRQRKRSINQLQPHRPAEGGKRQGLAGLQA